MKKILFALLAVAAFAACSDDDETPVPEPQIETISFENADLGPDGYLWGKMLAEEVEGSLDFEGPIYKENGVSFLSFFSDWGMSMDTWCKFAISGCHDTTTEGMDNQFSVYTNSDDGQNQFAAAYDMKGMGPGYTYNPAVEFSEAVKPVSLRMANNTWTYLYLAKKYSDYGVTIIGFNGETETGTIDVALAAENSVVTDWTTVELDQLGTVDKIVFSVVCADNLAPTYFCIDDLSYTKE